jgi:hypothetical protein
MNSPAFSRIIEMCLLSCQWFRSVEVLKLAALHRVNFLLFIRWGGCMRSHFAAVAMLFAMLLVIPVSAQPQLVPPQVLDSLVQRIALYPDSLLSQLLAASTYWDQIPDAARWADAHHYLQGQTLADAITADQVPWDPSVQALLPFPSVLYMMANDMNWTQQLGSAFLAQPNDVMDAVQRERRLAYDYGYLRSNAQVVVRSGPYIEILPLNRAWVYVPAYDPAIVFVRPRPGFFVGSAVNFGFGLNIGVWFRPWGWGYSHFAWPEHRVVINNVIWNRTWVNRAAYMHPFRDPHVPRPAPEWRLGPAQASRGNNYPGWQHQAPGRPEPRTQSEGRSASAARPAPARPQPKEQHPWQPRSKAERQGPRNGHAKGEHQAQAHPRN